MAVDASVILGILQIVIQFVAAYFSFIIYKYNRLNKAWLAITVALAIIAFRRITALTIELGVFAELGGTIEFVDRILLPFVISVLLFGGLWSMKKSFESFEVVEKRVREKIPFFGKVMKKKKQEY